MLRKLPILFFLFSLNLYAQYPGLKWAHSYGQGGQQESYGRFIEYSPQGEIFTGGMFTGVNVDFDPDPNMSYNLSYHTFNKYYLTMLDTNQNFKWVKTLQSQYINISDVHIDQSGNILITGSFKGVLDADTDSLNTFNLHSTITPIPYQVHENPFIIKLDSDGNLIYARYLPSDINRYTTSIRPGSNGSVFVSGHTSGVRDLIISSDTILINLGLLSSTAFIIELDSTGAYEKHMLVPTSITDMDISKSKITIAGQFSGIVDFDPSSQTSNLNSSQGKWYVAQYDTSLSLNWAKNFGGSSGQSLIRGLNVSTNNDIFIYGQLGDSADFDPGPATSFVKKSKTNFSRETYLLNLDSLGTFEWVKTIHNKNQATAHAPTCLGLDDLGNIYLGGVFTGVIDIDPSPDSLILESTGLPQKLENDPFVVKFTVQGDMVWGFGQGGSHPDVLTDIALDANENIYLSGYYRENVDFDPSPQVDTLGAAVMSYMEKSVVQKLNQCLSYSTDRVTSCTPFVWKDSILYTHSVDSLDFVFITYPKANGCDSIVYLDLEILPLDSTIFNVTACDTFTWRNQYTFTQSINWFPDTLVGSDGCDSILYLNLDLRYRDTSYANISACFSYTWIDSTVYYSDTTLITTLNDIYGCDSTVFINLDLTIIDTSLRDSSGIILANELQGNNYKWLDCSNNSITHSSGAIPYYSPQSNGTYAAIIDKNNCVDTSECITINNLDDKIHNKPLISLFPNPANEVVRFKIFGIGDFKIGLYNSRGQLVEEYKANGSVETIFPVQDYPAGVYSIKLIFKNEPPICKRLVIAH